MVVIIDKVMPGEFAPGSLQAEINASGDIVPSCTAIVGIGGQDIKLTFAAALSEDEETVLDALLVAHVPPIETISISSLPLSNIDGKKIAVHSSPKPQTDKVTYAVWTGAGDDLNDPNDVGGGDMLAFVVTPGTASVSKNLQFNDLNGRIWVHEAYLKFDGGSVGDYIEGTSYAMATPLQTMAYLNLEIYDTHWVRFASGGPGTGTHGFADPTKIRLVPRSFSTDGDWDYFPGAPNPLVPNVNGTGGYKIATVDVPVHRYYNKIPCNGSCSAYFSMTSDETTLMPSGYYIKITAHNVSNTSWSASVIVEIYRERTYNP